MRIVRLALLLLVISAWAQVQTKGSVSLTGSVQAMAGGKHSVTVAWKASIGQSITFRIYRSTTSGAGFQMIQSQIPGLSFTDLNVNNATTYYYVVSAYDSSTKTESPHSNQVTANIPN